MCRDPEDKTEQTVTIISTSAGEEMADLLQLEGRGAGHTISKVGVRSRCLF
jgi:hypothetical protein